MPLDGGDFKLAAKIIRLALESRVITFIDPPELPGLERVRGEHPMPRQSVVPGIDDRSKPHSDSHA